MALAVGMNKIPAIREYIIKEKIGTGSYGVVFKVMNKNDKKIYVLKQISLFGLNKSQIADVKNESKILSQLNSPWVVKYCDSFEENNNLDIVMEYCDGGDLSNYLNNKMITSKPLTEEMIWKIYIQISLGLAYIHRKKILHRDLKTLNIFLTKDLDVKIGDLGVAKALIQTSFAKTFVGTPYYLSPEICEEKPYNEKSDVWALGCILYEMSTYKHPFNATNQAALIIKILKGKYDPISPKYSSELRKMIDSLLEKSDFKRPSMDDVIKNPIFLSKAKLYGMLEFVLNCYNEINYSVEEIRPPDKKKSVSDNPIVNSHQLVNNPAIISTSNSNNHSPIKSNVKVGIQNHHMNSNGNVNLINEKFIKVDEKKLIQMNLPNNFKKELLKKKEKKENAVKQNQMVKQIVLGSAGNGGMAQLPINPVNKIVFPINHNLKKPIKVTQKDRHDSESLSDINKKIEEVSKKMDEFDRRCNLIKKKDEKMVVHSVPKRPSTTKDAKNDVHSNEKNKQSWSEGDDKEQYSEKSIKKTKHVIQTNQEKPIVQDKSKNEIIPSSNETDGFAKLINGNLRCTEFFDELKNVPIEKLIGNQNSKQLNIHNFVKELDKKTQNSNRITLSDFMRDDKDEFRSKIHPIMDNVHKNFKEVMIPINKNTSEVSLESSKAENLMNSPNEFKAFLKSKAGENNVDTKANNLNVTAIVHKIDDTIDPAPILFNSGEASMDFQVVEDHENIASEKPVREDSSIEEDIDYSNAHRANKKSHREVTNEAEDDIQSDEECEEGIEQVCVIKDKDFGFKKTSPMLTEVSIPVQMNSELFELKEKFLLKIEYYKNECKKSAGEKQYNQIFEYYHEIERNSADIDDIGQKIEAHVTTSIPDNCAVFIQSFYNLIYYDIQLGNVLKELEEKKYN